MEVFDNDIIVEEIYIFNVGLVLIVFYLLCFFFMFESLEDGVFKDLESV